MTSLLEFKHSSQHILCDVTTNANYMRHFVSSFPAALTIFPKLWHTTCWLLDMLALMLTLKKNVGVILSCWLKLTLIPWDRSVAVCGLAAYAKCCWSCRLVCGHQGREKANWKVLTWLTGLIKPGVRWHGSDTHFYPAGKTDWQD